jgi:hypothetical protein
MAGDDGLTTVRLVHAPAELYLEHFRNLHDLIHELQTMAAGDQSGIARVPGRLGEVMRGILEEYQGVWMSMRQQALEALERSDERVDIEMLLPREAAEAVRRIHGLVEEAEKYCELGEMLALPSSEEIWRLRTWIRDEVVAQLELGAEPAACPI